MNLMTTRRNAVGVFAALPLLGQSALAQAPWPSRPIRIVVPYPAGGAADVLTRVLAEQAKLTLNAVMNVEPRPGASGLMGMQAVMSSPADGYTFANVSSGHVTLTAMNPKFELLKQFKPIIRVTASPFGVLVGTNSPYKTLPELIAAVKAQPGKISYGTAGPGSPAHMAVAYLEDALKDFQALHVPFKGAVESIVAIMGGQIDFAIGPVGAAMPHLKAGKLRVLAVTPAKRVTQVPDVPTIAEATNSTYRFQSWLGYMAPAGTPDDSIERLAQSFAHAARSEAFTKFIQTTGDELDLLGPSEFRERLIAEVDIERRIVQRLGLNTDK